MTEERRCIDYDAEARKRFKWLDETGGAVYGNLTVRDYFAAKAIQVYLTATMGQMVVMNNVAENAYAIADVMMAVREERYKTAHRSNDFINEQMAKVGETW